MEADQAQALRQMVTATAGRRARIVAITSGKGGVGKSNVAVNLAVRLSQMGRSVVLLDGDLGTANADVLCNLPPGQSLARVVAGQMTLQEAMIDAPGGFKMIRGASGLAQIAALGEFERERLMQQIQALEHGVDLVLIDTGAGVSPNVLGFSVGADQLLVVTTPEPTAVTDAYALMKAARRHRDDLGIHVVVNMVRDSDEGRDVFNRLDAVCRRFLKLNVRYAGHVMLDARVAQAVRNQRPFMLETPGCPAGVCISQLAHRMDRYAVEPQEQGWLRRMASWLAG